VNTDDITLDDEYYECMSICVENNPAMRSEAKWCDYVQRLEKITASDLKALLHATRPSRMVSLLMSYNMQKSVAILCGKLNLNLLYPEIWAIIHPALDAVMADQWAKRQNRDTYVDRKIWVSMYSHAVFSFFAKEDYEVCAKAAEDGVECPMTPLRRILNTALGKALFSEEGKQFQLTAFINRCHERAFGLLHNDFSQEDIDGYHEAAKVEIKILVQSGQKRYFKATKIDIFSPPSTLGFSRKVCSISKTGSWKASPVASPFPTASTIAFHGSMSCGGTSPWTRSARQHRCLSRCS
jgi:hypothetical protein